MHREEEVRDLMRGCTFFEFRLVSVRLMEDGVLFNHSRKRSCIDSEEARPKDWSLWNTERDGCWLRCVALYADRLGAVCKVGCKPD